MMELDVWIGLPLLIILSGFFSASETALTALKRRDLVDVDDKHPKISKLLKTWIKSPNNMLTAILIGNNIVNIYAASLATSFALKYFNGSRVTGVVTIVLTILILIFGEITPKIIAKTYSKKVSCIVIRPIYYLSKILFVFIKILSWISKFISRIFGIKITDNNIIITEEDIRSMVSVGEEEGIIEEEERNMIHSIFDFGDSSVREVMVPRTSMYAIEGSKTLEEIWDEIIKNGYSRIPVYQERIDNIIGIVYIKDLLEIVMKKEFDKPIKNFIREAYFIPETKLLAELLKDFKKRQTHMAVVLDEYGGTVGLVTLEDLIEEILGEINDEYDNEEELIKKVEPNKYKIDAIIDIDLLNKKLELSLPEVEDYDSLGGFIYSILGRVPEAGDDLEWENVKLRVLKVDNHRIAFVLLEVVDKEELAS